MDLELFPGISLDDGEFLLSAGVKLSAPFELTLNDAGGLSNGMELKNTLTSRLAFEPHGQVAATLPFTVTISSFIQDLVILIHDDDLFDNRDVLVKVDFSACALSDLLQQMLGKLGSFQLSADSILGGNNLPFNLANIAGTLDELFPDVGQFVNGVLEGEQFLFASSFIMSYCICYLILSLSANT